MYDLEIRGQLIIYLDDGSVIKSKKTDYVDNTSIAAFPLTMRELNLMKNSNINTVRYTLEHGELQHPNAGNYTASNKGDSKIDFPAVISNFFN